jgi:spermidine synthase
METSVVRQQRLPISYSPPIILLIGICFVLSGATGLIYEVLWARMLGLVFGATTLAVSTVLAAFMGGLALGSAFAGRLGSRIERPLRAYGLIEIGIAAYALLVPLLFNWVDNLYAFIWQQFHPGFFVFSLWRFVLSCALLLVPTTLMGATLPVLSAALLRSAKRNSNSVTRLYACNLAGAILGTLAAGFVFLPSLGVRSTIVVAATLNVIVGAIAVLAERKVEGAPATHERPDIEVDASTETAPVAGHRFWLLCALASGFVTISTQVAWTRVLAMVIGSSTYAFSIVVALFLIGLAGGAWLVGRSSYGIKLRESMMKIEVAIGISLFMSLFVINWIPNVLVYVGLRFHVSSWGGLLLLQIICASMLILVPALLMGMVMPAVLVWASTNRESSVRLVGRSYAINTIGAIAGAFITGFLLIPKTSTKHTLLFSAAICVIVAGAAYLPRPTARDPQLHRAISVGATVLVILLLFISAPSMNLGDLSVGAYDSLIRVLAQTREGVKDDSANEVGPAEHRLLMYQEGATSTVSVRKDWQTTSLAINGRANASDREDMPTQVMLGQLPLLVAPSTRNGLVIGFASGVTVGAMLQSPIESLDCVELEPATIPASRFFEHVNNRPLNDPRLHLLFDDARTYLRVTPKRYDMIISEPSHPWVPGVANLFTREFFEMTRERLSDDGVFVQWVQIYQMSTETLRSVLATYQDVFPHVLVFRVGGVSKGKDLLLVGSNRPMNLDRLAERITEPRMSAEIARVNLKSEGDVRAWYVCDETTLRPAVSGAKLNTDDNMHIETTVPREAFRPLLRTNGEWVQTLAVKKQE